MGRRFETLDGMRGLCALLIALYHSGLALGTPSVPPLGRICVDMFFVLSGFVIALTYEDKLKIDGGFSAFLIARGRRLLPTQTIGTAICFLATIPIYLMGRLTAPQIAVFGLTGLLLIPLVWTPLGRLAFKFGHYPADNVIWSLHAEWVINLIYGKLLYRASIAGLTGFCLFCLITQTWLEGPRPLWAYPFQAFCEAGFGFTSDVILYRLRAHISRLPAISPYVLYAIWGLFCCFPHYELTALQEAMVAIAAAQIIALLVRNEQPVGNILKFLGRVSYPLYASHMAVIYACYWAFTNRGIHNGFWAIPIVAGALILAAGIDRSITYTRIGTVKIARVSHRT